MYNIVSLLLLFLCLFTGYNLSAYDKNMKNFEEQSEFYTEQMDFSGEFPLLEKITIDAKRKKRVYLDLSGSYPLLKHLSYEGTFGILNGVVSGDFPMTETISFLTSSCAISLDFRGRWTKSIVVTIKNFEEDIHLIVPEDVGVGIKTVTSFKGKVIADKGLKQLRGKWRKKFFVNNLYSQDAVNVVFNVETSGKGNIILNRS